MDERLAKIEEQKQLALNENNNLYNNLLQDNQNLLNQQNEYANAYEKTQNETLDKQLAYQENLINQQKDIAKENKSIESKKAKNDFTSYTNPYGLQAESFASNGLLNSGVSETAKLGAWNTYQNRLATANKAMQDAFTQYDNDINQARLNNDVQKAQNALEKLKMQLSYNENYFNNKTNLSQNQFSNNQNLNSEYYNRYQTEYNNIQNEKAQEEAIRQFNEQLAEQRRQYDTNLAYQKEQDRISQANWEKEYALSKSISSNKTSGNSAILGNNGDLNDNSASLSLNGLNIIKNPYTDTINPDTQYGVFDTGDGSGYQPNNINGKKLTKSGMTMSEFVGTKGSVNSGNKNIDNHNVWKLGNNYYIWDGYENEYVDITNYNGRTKKDGGKNAFGSTSGGFR